MNADDRDERGYRPAGRAQGARIRADVIEVLVFRAPGAGMVIDRARVELLQIRRAKSPLEGTWQPVMGHIEAGESAVRAAARELREEIGLDVLGSSCQGFWALEQVRPYYIAAIDCVVLPPRFACRASESFQPVLNHEHTEYRWVLAQEAARWFVWPGQIEAAAELLDRLLAPDSLCEAALRIDRALC